MILKLLAATAMFATPVWADAARCSVGTLRNNPEGYFWPLSDIRAFVRDADLIVRATAVERVGGNAWVGSIQPLPSSINFQPLEVLKGDGSTLRILVAGDTISSDDYNRGAVPYRMVRSNGASGNCFATGYKLKAEYLLIMKRTVGDVFTPYWAALAPMNEQVRGADDAWVLWVRDQVRGRTR